MLLDIEPMEKRNLFGRMDDSLLKILKKAHYIGGSLLLSWKFVFFF